MENAEEILQALDQFSRLKPKEIPPELEEYLRYVSKTGDPIYQWTLIKPLFVQKLFNVISEFFESSPILEIPPSPNVEPFNYERMKTSLIERLETFINPPFTIQRICELLVSPRNEYNRIDKYMRAVEKNVLVVSTREPNFRSHTDNDKIPEAINGIPENNGTAEEVDVNMLNSDLTLQNTSSQPTDELLDIKADELEMDSLLMESIPGSKWVKNDTMAPDISSVVSMAAEITSGQGNSVEPSTDIDLVSNSDNNSTVMHLDVKTSSTPETVAPEPTIEPMCVEQDSPETNVTELSTTEPMAVEPTAVETMAIETPDLPSESTMQASDSIEIESSLEPVSMITNETENSTDNEPPVSHLEPIDINPISNSQNNDVCEAEVKDLNLITNESITEDQSLVMNDPLAIDAPLSVDVPLSAVESEPTADKDNSVPGLECEQLSSNTDVNLDNCEMLTVPSSEEYSTSEISKNDDDPKEENLEMTKDSSATNQSISTEVEEIATLSVDDIHLSNMPLSEENLQKTTSDQALNTNVDTVKTPIVTMPDDETTLTEASSSMQEKDTVQIPVSEDVSVSLLDESEPPSTSDEITSTPVVVEPEDDSRKEDTISSAEITQE